MTIVAVIAPVFILVLAGYLADHFGVLKIRDIEGLSHFVFNIALPVLLFESLATITLPPQMDWIFLFAYYLVVVVIYGLGMWLSRRWFAAPAREQSIFGMGASYSNLMLVGLPILVWLLVFHAFDVDPLWGTVAVMAAGMPVGISAYIYAENYHLGTAALSTAVLLSILLAIFSQSIWLLLLT